uniref:Cytochrome P450 n=2 Tax=Photinus pyralis TaxID=7054 RepID=A0A1Y1MUP6_PHOPY
MPDSLISAIDIQSHARIRKALAPGFTQRALKAQEPILQLYVNLLIERLCEYVQRTSIDKDTDSKASDVDIVPWLNFTTFDIFGDLGFGESFDCLHHSKYHPWVLLLFNSVKAASFVVSTRFYPFAEYILLKCIPPSLRKKQSDHYKQIVDKVQRRLNFELQRPDIMSHVISQKEQGEEGITLGEINTTFMVLTTAGSETTATTLAGTLMYLVQNEAGLDALVREIRSSFQNEQEITLDALRRLPVLNAVISEGLRLCPAVPWILPRKVPVGGGTVCGIWLPGGTSVSIQAYTMYRDPSHFHEATSFLPERWFPEASSDTQSVFYNDQRQAVQPFSIGPRSCMGQYIAWAEMRLILSRLLWKFDIEAVKENMIRWEDLRTFLLVEKKPVILKLKVRAV